MDNIKGVIEAILFAAGREVETKELALILEKSKVEIEEIIDIMNKEYQKAEKILEDLGINVKINCETGEYTKNSVVTRQIPDEDISITEGSNVILYVE